MTIQATIRASVHAFDMPKGGLVGPSLATLGIDFQAASAAPGGELIRVNYGTNDDMPGALELALAGLRAIQPLVIVRREEGRRLP